MRRKRTILQSIACSLTFVLAALFLTSALAPVAPARAATPKTGIYILPGYMESNLYSKKFGGMVIWAGPGLATEIGLDATGAQPELANNATGTGMSAYADRTRDKDGVFGIFLPMITSINASLAANGLSDSYKVEFFSYNWLADLNDTARELAADINAKGYDKVIFICHSNGGLLASTYISQSAANKSKVAKAISIASPMWGTYTALEPVETGAVTLMDGTFYMGLLEMGYDAFVKPISKHWVYSWAKNSPDTYQLQAGNEYVSRVPILYRTSTGTTQAITNPTDYYALLSKSPNANAALVSGSVRSLKYLRETVYGKDVLQKWSGIDLTMLGCEYGFITPNTAVYHQSGVQAIYDGPVYNKAGDSFIEALSMNGDGQFKFVNIPGASHILIVMDPRTLAAVNNIILGRPVSSSTDNSSAPTTSSTLPSVGMSDMIRVEIKSSDPLVFPTLTNLGIGVKVYDKLGKTVAQSQGEAQVGFGVNNFIYTSWSTSENTTNIICYIPKNNYTMEVFSGNLNRAASDIKVYTETLDPSGGFLSQNEYKVTGANLLTGSAFTLNGGKSVAPVPSLGAKLTTVATVNYKQNWQFSSDTLTLDKGATATPNITGPDASSMVKSNYYWTSSNTAVATVSTAGVITALAPGTAAITATAKDGSCKIASVKVIVEPNKFTVTFDAQGGNPAPPAVTVNSGSPVSKPADPVKEGATFAGWYNGAIAYDFSKAVTANLTLTAKWTLSTYTVTFDSQGGTAKTAAKVNYGAKVTKPTDPIKTGAVFNGWALNGAPYDFNTPVTADITLTAVWIANGMTVTFDAQGGTPAPPAVTVNYGTPVSKPADPVKEGFTFAGWYNGAIAYDFSKTVTTNLTLTAKWTQITYTVTFDSQGGTAKAAAKVNYGAKVTKPTDPIKTGAIFNGWALNGAPYDFNTPVTADITLTAMWN
ncbi:MAG: InlB B-repeat-containing protein [Firmicutes bacterium]|nr:InlB B-repeat-containing protein [Bacillota bacterium]